MMDDPLPDTLAPAWRQAYERDPEGTRAKLRELVEPKPQELPTHPADELLIANVRKTLGLREQPSDATARTQGISDAPHDA